MSVSSSALTETLAASASSSGWASFCESVGGAVLPGSAPVPAVVADAIARALDVPVSALTRYQVTRATLLSIVEALHVAQSAAP